MCATPTSCGFPPQVPLANGYSTLVSTIAKQGRASLLQTVQTPSSWGASLYGVTVAWPHSDSRVWPGDTLPVTLVWQPYRTPEQRLRTFVQLLDAQNRLLAVSDHEPSTPTLPAGSYRLVVGIYDAASGQRLLSPDGRDMLVIANVQVESP